MMQPLSLRWSGAALVVAALLIGLGGVPGCALLRADLSPPQATLVAVELTELALRQQRFRLVLDLENPNTVALPVSELSYAVALAGAAFAEGRTDSGFRVPAGGRERVRLTVTTDLLRSAEQLYALIAAGGREIDYQLDGRVKLDMPLRPTLKFDGSGTVALTR